MIHKYRRTILLLFIFISMCCTGFYYVIFWRQLHVPPGYILRVRPGDTSRDIAGQLSEKKVLNYQLPFIIYARLRQQDRHMQAGEYALPQSLTINQLVALIHAGRVIRYAIRFQEGVTFRQMLAQLAADSKITRLTADRSSVWVMQHLGYAYQSAPGRFFPDTYYFYRGDSDLKILGIAYTKMQSILQQQWAQRAAGLPYVTPYQALIMASMIESEAAVASERSIIASVLLNRLRKGMRLQVDTTVLYGLHKPFGSRLARSDLSIMTPYNTYMRAGLPPTPIGMPSQASIHAALHPAHTSYYYYVAKPNREHKFSVTYAEHKAAIAKYLLQSAT